MASIEVNFSCDINHLSFLSWTLLNKFKFDQNQKSSKFYRYINEIPTLLLIFIIFVVIFKPI